MKRGSVCVVFFIFFFLLPCFCLVSVGCRGVVYVWDVQNRGQDALMCSVCGG